MSLLNEALRKKAQEKTAAGSPPRAFSNTGRRRGVRGKSLWLMTAVVAGASLLFAVWLLQPERTSPGSVAAVKQKQPDSASATVAAITAGNDTAVSPQSATTQTAQPPTNGSSPGAAKRPVPGAKRPAAAPARGEQKSRTVAAAPDANANSGDRQTALVAPYWQKALSYHREGEFPQAITMYQEVLKRAPGHAEAQLNLAAAYLETQEYSHAHSLLTTLSARTPEDPRIWLNLAIAALGLGQAGEALDSLRLAEQSGAERFDIYLHRGAALRQLGRTEEAFASYREAERVKPDEPSLIFNLAIAYDQEERFDDALRYYERFLRVETAAPRAQRKRVEERASVLRTFLRTASTGSQPS